ncbi:MAG TPA: TetR/AcrR family transcriptional regulator [Methylocella sp.]|nr:TetR/AcrR family transcriptional regulator [Methylocella sp.]
MADEKTENTSEPGLGQALAAAPKSPREAIIDALMELASERSWEDITISDIADRAGLSLATFRDHYPSKGAVLAGFSRRIDCTVLEAVGREDLSGEPQKERLFDVLMRRLDALTPYKLAIEAISDGARRDPLGASALNRVVVNSMRFMLEAAGIESEGAVGALKLQGLTLAWGRILRVWLQDDDPGLASTMAALDRELTRGGQFIARAEDVSRLVSPLFMVARSLFEGRPTRRDHASPLRKDKSHNDRMG